MPALCTVMPGLMALDSKAFAMNAATFLLSVMVAIRQHAWLDSNLIHVLLLARSEWETRLTLRSSS